MINNMNRPWFDRNETLQIKGVALIFMFVHHFFTVPIWYVSGISYDYMAGAAALCQQPTKICVCLFAFLNGYLYRYSSDKSLRGSVCKAWRFLVPFWLVTAAMIIFAVSLNRYVMTPENVLLELFGMREDVMIFCWYVYFYLIILFLLPGMDRLLEKRSLPVSIAAGMFLPAAMMILVISWLNPESTLWEVLDHLRTWLPAVMSGWIFARYSLFEKMEKGFSRLPVILQGFLCLVMMTAAFFGRWFLPALDCGPLALHTVNLSGAFNMDVIYAPLFIFALITSARMVRLPWKPLEIIGKYSMYMWYLHCLFFNCTKPVTQIWLFFPRNPVLVLLWGLLMTLGVSVILDTLVKKIMS